MLKIDHLTARYASGRQIFQDVSLSIDERGVTAVLGPGGSGKSTLLNLLHDPTPNEGIFVQGQIPRLESAIFSQGTSSLTPLCESQSKWLLVDEPFGNQASNHRQEIIDTLTTSQKNGQAVVLTTHDLILAKSIATWVVLLVDGEVIEEGTNDGFFRHPQKTRTQNFIRLGS